MYEHISIDDLLQKFWTEVWKCIITVILSVSLAIALSSICEKYLNTGRVARDLEWILCFILKPSWSWIKDVLKRTGKQTVQCLDELWLVKGTSKNEVSKDADIGDWSDLKNTDDNWSMCIDTPSETERSCTSNTTSRSTDTVPGDRKKSRRAGASNAIDTAFNPKETGSYIDASNQTAAPQNRPKRHVRQETNPGTPKKNRITAKSTLKPSMTTQQPEFSKPKTSHHTSKRTKEKTPQNHTIRDSHLFGRDRPFSVCEGPPMPILSSKGIVEYQPAEIVILEVRKGINFKKKLIVRMYRTSPFTHLKSVLRSDEMGDDTHDLAIRNEEGYYLVFDNDTPLSVSLFSVQKQRLQDR